MHSYLHICAGNARALIHLLGSVSLNLPRKSTSWPRISTSPKHWKEGGSRSYKHTWAIISQPWIKLFLSVRHAWPPYVLEFANKQYPSHPPCTFPFPLPFYCEKCAFWDINLKLVVKKQKTQKVPLFSLPAFLPNSLRWKGLLQAGSLSVFTLALERKDPSRGLLARFPSVPSRNVFTTCLALSWLPVNCLFPLQNPRPLASFFSFDYNGR